MTPSSQNRLEKTQICISNTTGGRKIKTRNYKNFGSKIFFWRKKFRILKHQSSLWHHYEANYQSRICIQDAFFNFLKLWKVLITDWTGYLTGELLSQITVFFTEHHSWLIINGQAYCNRPELSNFDKITGRRCMQSHWLTYIINH